MCEGPLVVELDDRRKRERVDALVQARDKLATKRNVEPCRMLSTPSLEIASDVAIGDKPSKQMQDTRLDVD